MNKKSILITVCSFDIGGIEKSLTELLNVFDYDKYDVDVLCFSKRGELLPYVPQKCKILPEVSSLAALLEPIKSIAVSQPLIAFGRVASKIKVKLKYKNSEYSEDALNFARAQEMWNCVIPFMPAIKKEYDIALSFMWPHHFVSKKVKAKKKIAWIHTDYTKAALDFKADEDIWDCFDYIAAVSDECGEAFKTVYPSLAEKVKTVENVLSPEMVRARAKEFAPTELKCSGIKLVSVGRYCYAKGFDRIPEICKFLTEAGHDIKWFIIGFGTDEDIIREQIKKYSTEERVILLGKKTNPYPYIKDSDIYVQPSRYEGKAVSIREAQIIGKAVVIADFKTARSQVNDGIDAVVAGQSEKEIADAIANLITDSAKKANLEEATANADYGCGKQLEALYALLD